MKAVFDILLVIIMLTVMVMLLLGVNQLADVSGDSSSKTANDLNENYESETKNISKRGLSGIFLLLRSNINGKNR